MPAPLAKGLLLSLSLLFAASLAAYENPRVRQWIDESRRKVAIALHSLGDEVAPRPSESRDASPDASTREDEDPEAVERRRKARQEILERGRIVEERRRSRQTSTGKAKNFDDLVDKDGALKVEEPSATTTAAEPQAEEPGLRHRQAESKAAALGSTFANPFADEMHIESVSSLTDLAVDHASPHTVQDDAEDPPSRSRTPTLTISPTSPPVPPKPAAYQPQHLLIDTDEISHPPSEELLDLTPTTSASSFNADPAELNDNRQPTQSNYWSVNEWAENHAAAFYSPPASVAQGIEEKIDEHVVEGPQAGSGEHASQAGSEDFDVMSDDETRISTPGSWTEVGSQVSEYY